MFRTPHQWLLRLGLIALLPISPGWTSSALALSHRTTFVLKGVAQNDFFGRSVARAGDFNGDGFEDIVVGAPQYDVPGPDAGRVYVYFGGPSLDDVPDLTLSGAAAGDNFGAAVASAGDLNGDGFDELIVGSPLNDAGGADAGRVYVYLGGTVPDAGADLTFTGAAAGDRFGFSVASAGDVDANGIPDVIVGAPLNDAGGADAGRVYLYRNGSTGLTTVMTGAAAGDNFGYSVAPAGDMNGDGFSDLVVGAPLSDGVNPDVGRAYVYFGTIFPDNVADLSLTFGPTSDNFGYAVASAGDVNGDGFSDLIVSAPLNDAGGADAGRAFLYLGGPIPNSVADLDLLGAAAGDNFGHSVSSAGDLNGDGYDDVIVGAYLNDGNGTDSGRAYVYYCGSVLDGTADLLLTGELSFQRFGASIAAAGDVNGDGFPDLLIGAELYYIPGFLDPAGGVYVIAVYPYQVLSPNGGESWISGKPAKVRWRGHDFADVALSLDGGASWNTLASGVGGSEENEIEVLAPGPATELARIRVSYHAQPVGHGTSDLGDAVFTISLPQPPVAAAHRQQSTFNGVAGEFLGNSVASAGDFNGDRFPDVIVGAPRNDAGGVDAGRAYIFYGGPLTDGNADLTLTGAAANDYFGYSVAGVGDVNGDGFDDVIVGAYQNDAGGPDAGRAYVYYGGAIPNATADVILTGAAANDHFGESVASAGDVNGDRFADVIVGAPLGGTFDGGSAYVFFGGPLDAIADLTLSVLGYPDLIGMSVASAGDVNGDGFDDMVVGAPASLFSPVTGRAYVFLGGRFPDSALDLTLRGEFDDSFGQSVASAGDFNGDGFDDVIVGAYESNTGGFGSGRAYIFHGGRALDAHADLVLTGTTGQSLGRAVASAGDVNEDGLGDVIAGAHLSDVGAGRAYVYHGGADTDGLPDLILAGHESGELFGFSVVSAGDVNGDGVSDLVVGAYNNDDGGANSGRAYLYDCNRYFVLSPNDDEVWNVGAQQAVSWLGGERADVWLSVDGGATYDLLRRDVGGSETNVLSLLVPHLPTRFARVRITPADPNLRGLDESDSTFTIQSSVALLLFTATLTESGADLSWSTDPGVSAEGLSGYRLYRLASQASGNGERIGPDLIADSHYLDTGGSPGHVYRLVAVNGLQEELELGRVGLAPAAPLAAWPLPYRGDALHVSFGVNGLFGSGTGDAVVELFDLSGRLVKTIARGRFDAGFQTAQWDGRDERGVPVRSGIYFLRVESAGVMHRLKLAVLR